MRKIYLLFVWLGIFNLSASAQIVKANVQTLRAIGRGEQAVVLANTANRFIEPAYAAQMSSFLQDQWRTKKAELTRVQHDLLLTRQRSGTDTITYSVQSKTAQQMTQALRDALCRWGQFEDQTNSLGYTLFAKLEEGTNNTAWLDLNGKKVQIRESSDGTFALLPSEIQVNASTVKALIDSYAPPLHILSQQEPQNIAGFVYLKTNFSQALQQFQAAEKAYATLDAHEGLFAGLQNHRARRTQTGQLILRNYHYSSANLALYTVKMLRFMNAHPTLFPNAISSYEQIMHLHNINFGTPNHFQIFWNQDPTPSI